MKVIADHAEMFALRDRHAAMVLANISTTITTSAVLVRPNAQETWNVVTEHVQTSMVTIRQTADLAETHVLLAKHVAMVFAQKLEQFWLVLVAMTLVLMAKLVVTEIALTPKRTKPIAVVAETHVLLVKHVALAYVLKTNAEHVLLHVPKVKDVVVRLQI